MPARQWYRIPASWPVDGQEVWVRPLNGDAAPYKAVFVFDTLSFIPSNVYALKPPSPQALPFWFVSAWSTTP
jgi:hypothetical protein